MTFQIPDQENARKARPGDPFTFTVDASKTGWGEVAIDVVFENRSIRRTFYVEEVGNRIYQVIIQHSSIVLNLLRLKHQLVRLTGLGTNQPSP